MSATVVAAALRLPFLGHQSLWFDEIYTRRIVGEPSLWGVWSHVRATESTPPLYYVLAWLLGGRSAVSMRLIPAGALIIPACVAPLVPLVLRQSGDERAAFITGIPLMSRLTQVVRQFAMGANVPRTWLEAAGLAVAFAGLAVGVVLAARSGTQMRTLAALAALAFAMPLAIAVLGIEDRSYERNAVFVVPLVAALAAPALLRLPAVPLAAYLLLAALTSFWVASNWRYEQTDWRGALARTKAIDPTAGVIAVTQFGEPVAQTYLGRPPTTMSIRARRVWVVVEPYRAAHQRALGPAPAPTAISASLSGFTPLRELTVHGFRLILVGADRALSIMPAKPPGAAVFAPPT